MFFSFYFTQLSLYFGKLVTIKSFSLVGH